MIFIPIIKLYDHVILKDGRKLQVVEINSDSCFVKKIDERYSERLLIPFDQIEKVVEKYGEIIATVKDCHGEDLYSINVNMITGIIKLEYKNNQGGYTINCIKMTDEDYQHINRMRRCKHLVRLSSNFDSPTLHTNPNIREFKIIESDGDVYFGSKSRTWGVFQFEEEFINWVMERASFDNKDFKYF